jgi:hypothetical protein
MLYDRNIAPVCSRGLINYLEKVDSLWDGMMYKPAPSWLDEVSGDGGGWVAKRSQLTFYLEMTLRSRSQFYCWIYMLTSTVYTWLVMYQKEKQFGLLWNAYGNKL